jgi:hypothetical protein
MQWWLQIGDKPRQGKRQGQASNGLTRHLRGIAMSTKTTPRKAKRKKSKGSRPPANGASTISMATKNLINMVVVLAVSGTILLGLLAAKHF